ncbi:zinc-dependent metalloprotease [Shewanella intestini]|uniref:EcxA zinc-binding domain-containing protein n=1 Tax=Shewanella intestini TaxID=2017544 RepID=A0ABS5I2Y5_9GAMM|nr:MULTISPECIES: zinc-dependent metalloprotease [Shewanella]MBR9728385.1 hypothetical protein [Shewanella intestini]MRG36727.1 hypothetical protein [Shewanella sp. XMDDZSB0408]
MKKSTISLAILGAVALSGCGADEPYKEVKKDPKMVSVQDINKAAQGNETPSTVETTATSTSELAVKQPQRLFVYTRSLGEAPRYAAPIHGFTQGDQKLVTLKMTKNGIQVSQIDRDTIGEDHLSRFQNTANEAPVLSIPGDYVDFQCQKDNWDECTNREEEVSDRDVTWDQKKYFIPHFEDVNIAEENFTDLTTFLGCTTEPEPPQLVRDGDWKGYEMNLDSGVINFEIKHTYKASPSCFGKYFASTTDDLSFNTTEYISIIALDKLASKDYTPVPYSPYEDGTFGFFKTSHKYRDMNHSAGKEGYVRTYLNRFNPKDSEITYYLSNNFYEAKNKPFLDAAMESLAGINIQNKMYKTGLPTIKFEQAGNHRHGDIRYNNVTLFDEPLDNGLAGYGPSVSNPLTGEILSGRVDQYSSNLKQGAVRYYRRVQLDYNRGMLDANSVKALTDVDYTPSPKALARAKEVAANQLVAQQAALSDNPNTKQPLLTASATNTAPDLAINYTDDNEKSLTELVDDKNNAEAFWAAHNLMSTDEAFGLSGGGALKELPRGIKGHEIDWKNADLWVDGIVGGKLLAIEKMPTAVQDDLTTKLAAQGFAGTLTHELGHNFGLRHNFAGSRDQANFFNEDEIQAFHKEFTAAGYPNLTAKAGFSSQMDYNTDRFATAYGKYDLAALRFGYARKVETENGDYVSLKDEDTKRLADIEKGDLKTDTQYGALYNVEQSNQLRSFSYCTDNHLSLNSNCNMFDEGTNNDDIEQFYIDGYHDSYETANLRHNRQQFFEDDMVPYAIHRLREFDTLRQFVEDQTFAENLFGANEFEFSSFCNTAGNETLWFCASVRATDKAAKTFLEAAGLNDIYLQAQYFDKATNTFAFSVWHSLQSLITTLYSTNSYKLDPDEKFDIGKVITDFQSDPTKLNNLMLNIDLKPAYTDSYSVKTYVSGGHLLNGSKAPVSSPNHPYVNERDVLGMWPDKLLAVRQLLTRTTPRHTTGRSYYALVDNPAIGKPLEDMLCHMTMSTTTADINGLLTTDPLTESCGTTDTAYFKNDMDYADQEIEAIPAYARSVGRYFGFSQASYEQKGRSNLLQMMLKQVELASHDGDYRGEAKARVWREFVGIHLADDTVNAVDTISFNGKNYAITAENKLALNLKTQLAELNALTQNTALMTHVTSNNQTVKERFIDPAIARDMRVLTYLPVLK